MSEKLWSEVDDYFAETLIPSDPALDAALANSEAAGLPSIAVTPHQGKLLNLLARMSGAKSVLEVGTLGGYSTIWLARALGEGGRVVTLEADPKHAEVARANIDAAGLGKIVDVRLGRAIDTLPSVEGPFDLVFIDADKPSNAAYFEWALRLTKPGAVIVVDNVVRAGRVIDADSGDAAVEGSRRVTELVAAEPRVDATALQTVGAKGYDGFIVALVTS
ncbi:MAG: O-methyltransferase family protein [Amycolatopsis sp.]|jgi:predicted O-methyltransferase YrrM|uniref:O-methyltransferase n=1 Tax=Amycolatopsis sp. TaxID=37632 RepID=UPI0026281926|nr:O-methyltransferase [Amycolatopsis sp.]MCU1685080.1 O-methyltransferase family protein [Amycolatopsis sp.]